MEIERERVIIINNGRREFIDGQPGDGSAPPHFTPPPVARRAATAPNAAWATASSATSENEYEVPRAEIDKTLSNLNDVAMQARIVPAFKDGVAQGFKLFSIRPDSHLLEDRRPERRRDPPHQRLRPEQPREGARDLLEAERSLPHRDRDRAQRRAGPQDLQRPLSTLQVHALLHDDAARALARSCLCLRAGRRARRGPSAARPPGILRPAGPRGTAR